MKRDNIKTTIGQKVLLISFGIFILFLIEAGLRIFHVSERGTQSDPFVGFEKIYPLFGEKTNAEGKTVLATNPNKLSFFNHQEFERAKSANAYRIFCFGGSTTYGSPYRAETAFPNWMKLILASIDSTRTYEVINAGGISYASYRIIHLVEEALQYQPDLFVLYTGHNEFLEARTYENILQQHSTLKKIRIALDRSHAYRLLRDIVSPADHASNSINPQNNLAQEVQTILDESAGLDRYTRATLQQKKTFSHFRFNLEKIIRLARANGVGIMFVTPGSNVRDFSPFKSEHEQGLSESERVAWEESFRIGQINQRQSRFKDALIAYEKCLQIDNQYAELVYNIAICMDKTGQFDLAGKYFDMAKELDVCPLRAPNAIHAIIKENCEKYNAPVIDMAAEFQNLCPNQISDNTMFIDHVHPTIRGNQVIAERLVEAMQREGWISSANKLSPQTLQPVYDTLLSSLPNDYYLAGLINLAKVLGWAGKEQEKLAILIANAGKLTGFFEYHSMIGTSALRVGKFDEAIGHFRESIRLNPGHSAGYTNLGFALEMSGSPDEAQKFYEQALSLNPEDYVARANVARIFFIKSEFDKAVTEYKKAITLNEDYAVARQGLGVVYFKQGNTARALEELNEAVRLDPNYAEAYYDMGLVYLETRRIDDAMVQFQKAIKIDPFYADAYSSLGVCLYSKHQLEDAIANLKRAVDINPNLGKAHNNLAIAYHSAGNLELALHHVREAQRNNYTVHPQFWELLQNEARQK
ncbi:MAG: tetratricopeptide repeat protein [Candidatus Zhuqueibacterota bacterium]